MIVTCIVSLLLPTLSVSVSSSSMCCGVSVSGEPGSVFATCMNV